MERIPETKEEKWDRGERALLDMHMAEVLPENLELDREVLAGVIEGYIKDFQRLYSHKSYVEGPLQGVSLAMSIDAVRERARTKLAILDDILPIEGKVAELIPWDVNDAEAAYHNSGHSNERLTWCRFVDAMGKHMATAYPTIERKIS